MQDHQKQIISTYYNLIKGLTSTQIMKKPKMKKKEHEKSQQLAIKPIKSPKKKL